MHEVTIAEHLLELTHEVAAGQEVLSLQLEIGADSCVAPEALEFCFGLIAAGTPAAHARLDVTREPGRHIRLVALEVA